MSRLVIATSNPGKLREFSAALNSAGFGCCGLASFPPCPEPEETGATFADNARLKADYYFEHLGVPSLADDSGLEVAALDGRPGVHSARWESDDARRMDKILRLLDQARASTPEQRAARFVCALSLRLPQGCVEVVGTAEGTITRAPRGSQGFGYDPIFLYPPLDKTFAEIRVEEKNRISHRAQALRKLLEKLRC